MSDLAYDCTCHMSPPCSNCENWCENCEGTGKISVRRNANGDVDYIDGIKTGETDTCQTCNGEGTLL